VVSGVEPPLIACGIDKRFFGIPPNESGSLEANPYLD